MTRAEFAIENEIWEAFIERIAIMEFEGNMTHDTATIEALKIYYPADHAAMIKTCEQNGLDPLQKIPAFIDGMEAEQIQKFKEPITTPLSLKTRAGSEALRYFIQRGISLIGVYTDKRMIGKQVPRNFINDTAELTSLMAGQGNRQGLAKGTKIKRFYFVPADHGLFCLDIDAKEGKENGIEELLKIFDPDTLPDELQDIDKYFPCYVKTPNNGYHLYFKYSGQPIKNTVLFPGIEAKHGRPGLTAPGSINAEGKPYILHGDLDQAPPLFGFILDKIKKRGCKPEPKAVDKPLSLPRKNRITLDDLAAETTGGNHDKQVSFAGKVCRMQAACRKNNRDFSAYTAAAAIFYVKSRPDIFGNGRDTEGTIKSVFRDNGGL